MAERAERILLVLLTSAVAAGLAVAFADLPDAARLAGLVWEAQGELELAQPVTAVLLAFRGYDTLLEVAVLVLAVVAVLVLVPRKREEAASPITAGPPASPLILWLAPRLVPMVVMIGGYLWWAGASRPGGAFQAGTLLSTAGVVMLLSQQLRPPHVGAALRAILTGGVLVFLAIGLMPVFAGGVPMQYPDGWEKALMMVIEAALAFTIATAFVVLVVGVPPRRQDRFPGDRR